MTKLESKWKVSATSSLLVSKTLRRIFNHALIITTGGGIIGSTTAYFLTRHPKFNSAIHKITLLEAAPAVATGASGKAGGLLALWAYPACLVPLSYKLHGELAAEHNGAQKWGYRRLTCGSMAVSAVLQVLAVLYQEPDAALAQLEAKGAKLPVGVLAVALNPFQFSEK